MLNDDVLIQNVTDAASSCVASLKAGGKIWFGGNGGSAADAQHLAAELSGRYCIDRKPLPAEALHVNTSFLTAVANDYGYDKVYARMLEGNAKAGDVFFAISTSGNSANIINAIDQAKAMGVKVIGMTGESGGKMKGLCDILINVPSDETPRIQEAHVLLGHIICGIIENELFG